MLNLDQIQERLSSELRGGTIAARDWMDAWGHRFYGKICHIADALDALDERDEVWNARFNFDAAGTKTLQIRAGWLVKINRITGIMAVAAIVDVYDGPATDPGNLIDTRSGVTKFAEGMNGYPGLVVRGPAELTVVSNQAGTVNLLGAQQHAGDGRA